MRNLLVIGLVIFGLYLCVMEFKGAFKPNEAQSEVVSQQIQDTSSDDGSLINGAMIYKHRVMIGIIVTAILCFIGVVWTKKFFNDL